MRKARFLIALLGVLFLFFGCPVGDDDDDNDASADDDVADDDVGDDDAEDNDAGDDDTGSGCPGAQPCTGDFDIGSEGDLADIVPCGSITGMLVFSKQGWLTSIDLPCAESVGDDLYIRMNDSLTSVDMPSLSSVGDRLLIENNEQLTSLGGFSNLSSVGGDLYIAYNNCVSQDEADAFAASLNVGGSISVSHNGADYPCN